MSNSGEGLVVNLKSTTKYSNNCDFTPAGLCQSAGIASGVELLLLSLLLAFGFHFPVQPSLHVALRYLRTLTWKLNADLDGKVGRRRHDHTYRNADKL